MRTATPLKPLGAIMNFSCTKLKVFSGRSNSALAERVARHLGDSGFSEDSRLWLEAGKRSLEEKLWGGDWYLLYHDPAAGRKSDTLLANQLAGQMCTYLHGLPPVVPRERVEKVLASVKRLCIESTKYGVVDAVLADGAGHRGHPLFREHIHRRMCFGGYDICIRGRSKNRGRGGEPAHG